MTDREKLVELIEATTFEALGGTLAVKGFATAKEFADHLIANGVTVKTPKKDKPPTDLTGKCGSCVHAVPTKAFGGSSCYVVCTNPARKHVKHIDYPRQRTCKGCKQYTPKEVPHEKH